MFTNILLAYDRSEYSQKAAKIAGDLARLQPTPSLRIITIVDPVPRELGLSIVDQLIATRETAGEEALDEAVRLIGEGVEIHKGILFGPVAETIIDVADIRQCDLIVIGSRGLGVFKSILLGSQTQKVISMSKCPVLVVK